MCGELSCEGWFAGHIRVCVCVWHVCLSVDVLLPSLCMYVYVPLVLFGIVVLWSIDERKTQPEEQV